MNVVEHMFIYFQGLSNFIFGILVKKIFKYIVRQFFKNLAPAKFWALS